MSLDFSFSTIFAGFIFGILGMYLIKEGRRTAHIPWIGLGVVLAVYPYFVSGAILTWIIGAALVGAAYWVR